MRLAPRAAFALIFVGCVALVGFAIYMQEIKGLEPCPMCVLQRYAFVAMGVVALAGALHGPGARGAKVYAVFLVLLALAGGGTAARQSWLQRHPPPTQACGTDLEFLVNNFPLSQALPKIFAGSGDCAEIKWQFLELTIPEWALVWFVLFSALAIGTAFAKRGQSTFSAPRRKVL